MKRFAVLIFGPTGAGKSSIAMELADGRGEIISVDSMQVYKYLDIGTAKPSAADQKKIKHHLIDIITPDELFSAGKFERLSLAAADDIIKRGKVPFFVGGTGLYFSALTRGMIDIPKTDPELKDRLNDKWLKTGQPGMYALLRDLDPDYSARIHPNDRQRTLRALEVYYGTGKKLSEYLAEENKRNDISYIKVGLNLERKELYKIIDLRTDKMIDKGLLNEVKSLKGMGYKITDPGIRAIGYRELYDHIEGRSGLDEAVDRIKMNTRRYAKRQMTWFGRIDDVSWFDSSDKAVIKDHILRKIGEYAS